MPTELQNANCLLFIRGQEQPKEPVLANSTENLHGARNTHYPEMDGISELSEREESKHDEAGLIEVSID